MTDRATLLALAERCEQAAGPDRGLDQDITKLLVPRNAEPVHRSRYGWSFIVSGSGKGFEWLQNQPYTASLDAAVTLVPEGRAWTVGQNVHHWHWQASINALNDEGSPTSIGFGGPCGWPALALCAAALRARAQPSSDT